MQYLHPGNLHLPIHKEQQVNRKECIYSRCIDAKRYVTSSVGDPVCLSWILIFIHPGSNQGNKRGGEKNWCPTFFAATNITKLKTILFLNRYSVIVFLTQKIVTKLSKIWVGDPGYEIRDPEKPIPDPRGQKAPDLGSGSATLPLRTGID